MRQGDGTDLLGPSDPRSASIGVIYVDPNDERQSVLTAILTRDKLGFKQVVVVLPMQNKAFQRPVDFDGLKHMRRGLKAEIVFIAPSGPGPAEFARQRRFPVYSSLKSFSQAINLETIDSGTANGSTKRGLFGFGRKQEVAASVAVASVSSSRTGEESTTPLPVTGTVSAPQESYSPKSGQDLDVAGEKNGSNGKHATALGLAAGAGLAALANEQNSSSTTEHIDKDSHTLSATDAGARLDGNASSNSEFGNGGREPTLAGSNEAQNTTDQGPGIITFSSNAPKPKITRKFPVPPAAAVAGPNVASELPSQRNGSNAASPNRRSNTGKMAAAVGGATVVGVKAAKANSAASGGGSLPPSGNSPAGPGGGSVGGTSRRNIILIAIVVSVIAVLVIGSAAIAFIPGAFNNITHFISGATATATVTITPDSQTLPNSYVIHAVTGTTTPDPVKRQVPAYIITSTSQVQSKTVTSTGSIPGTRATGTLTFLNSGSTKTFGSVILRGASGEPVTFNGPITVFALPGFLTVTGFAVNIGSAGNIGALDISGSCCAAGITVKNGAFSGGQNPQPNSVVLQSDINGAADALTASLTPGTRAAVQKQVKPNEKVVTAMQCNKSTFTANHAAGDHAPNVTVRVAITCKEEVYDHQAALAMASGLLQTDPPPNAPGPPYVLNTDQGAILTEVVKETVDKSTGIVTLNVKAQGVWVYHFDDSTLTGFQNHIANMKNQDAIKYLKAQPGVSDVKINNPNGDTLPDAAHIKIVAAPIPGATGSPTPGTGSVTPGSPTVAPTGAVTPPVTPTPTQGLGGS